MRTGRLKAVVERAGLIFALAGLLAAANPAAAPAQQAEPRAIANGPIAYDTNRGSSWDIYSMAPDGTGQVQLTSSGTNDELPAWSPDGLKIAYDDRADIWVMDADGNNATDLGAGRAPSWSPDGAHLAYATNPTGKWHIWSMTSAGASSTDLTPSCKTACNHPAWSPDGAKIAFAKQISKVYHLWVMNADGSGQHELWSGSAMWPSWSPSGKQIAFVHKVKRSYQLWVMSAKGKNPHLLVKTKTYYSRAAWSPDGLQLAVARRVSGDTNIWTMNADGSGLTNVTGPGGSDDSPSWKSA